VGKVLDEANVLIDPEDVIAPDPSAALQDGMTITVRKAHAVAVEADSEVRHVRTQAVDPLDILDEQHIRVGPYDVVRVDGQDYSYERLHKKSWQQPPVSIYVLRSATLKVTDGDDTLVIHTTAADVGRALDEAGIKLYLADRVTPGFSTPVRDGLAVLIERSSPVMLDVDGQRLASRTTGPTVGDALAVIGVAPVGLDYTIPPLDAPIEAGLVIRLVRVTEKIIVEREPIPFPEIRVPDDRLAPAEPRVLQEGVDGLLERQVRVRYEDGREVQRTVQEEQIIQTPTPRLITFRMPGSQPR
jgi:uncharacterized protein YabE (DUF348 family)